MCVTVFFFCADCICVEIRVLCLLCVTFSFAYICMCLTVCVSVTLCLYGNVLCLLCIACACAFVCVFCVLSVCLSVRVFVRESFLRLSPPFCSRIVSSFFLFAPPFCSRRSYTLLPIISFRCFEPLFLRRWTRTGPKPHDDAPNEQMEAPSRGRRERVKLPIRLVNRFRFANI